MRFKSILGAIIFILVACAVAFIVVIQTRTFGTLITKVITDISEKKAKTKVSIKSIGISLFPPGIELHKVQFAKEFSANKKLNAELGLLGFYIGLIELEEKKLSLGEIKIADSTIDYHFPESKEELKEIDQELIDLIFDLSDQSPLRIDTLLLENSRIFANYDLIEAKRLKIFKKDDSFMTRFHLSNLKPIKDNQFFVDEIWGDIQIGKENATIYRLKVQHDVHSLLVRGKIKNYRLLLGAELSLAGETTVHLKNLKDIVTIPEVLELKKGVAHANFNLGISNSKFSGNAELTMSDVKTNYFYADNLNASLEFKDQVISLNKLDLNYKKQKVTLSKPVQLANLITNEILYVPIEADLMSASLNNALRFLPSLKPLKGNLTGHIVFSYDKGNYFFNTKNGFMIEDLGLIVGEKKKPFKILMIKNTKVSEGSFRIVKNEFQMDGLFELKSSVLDLHGFVNSKKVSFNAENAVIDLEDFGNISQLDVKGKGTLNLNVSGPLNDTVINLKGQTNGFEVLGYKLGQADKDISISLKDSTVLIHKMEANYRNTPISGTGVINYGNSDIALGIHSTKANFLDLKETLAPIFSKLTFLPTDLDLTAKIDADIFGKTSLAGLRVKSNIQFSDLLVYGESLNSGEFNILMENQVVSIQDFQAAKGKGAIRGDFSYSLLTQKMKAHYDWEDLSLSSFNLMKKIQLNLNGNLFGTIDGEGTSKDFLFHAVGKIDENRTNDYTFDDSSFDIKIAPSHIYGKMNLLGKIIDSSFDVSFNNLRPTTLKVSVDAPQIKPFAVAFLGQHIEGEDFDGEVKFELETSFRGAFEDANFSAALNTLKFKHENFNVDYKGTSPQFLIENNRVKKWDLNIQESDFFLKTNGEGVFGKEVSLVNEFYFNSRIFEILLSPVLSSDGFIRNILRINGKGNKYNFLITSKSSDLDITIDVMPFPFNNLSYDIDFSNDRLTINDAKTSLENGSVNVKGEIFFDSSDPDVNLKVVLDKAEIPILGKSVINLTGEGIILGNGPPYNLSGEVVVNKAQIVNELNDFNQKSSALSQVRFLPANQESPLGKLLNLNLNLKLENPARISNSLMDVSLRGEVRILGNPGRPRGEGRLFSPTNSSRVFFKNNEYTIINADLNFSPKKELSNPDFDIQALTLISSYKVSAKAYGDLERFNFDLTSDPALTRNSILSLIAFGYTDEVQSSLKQGDQQSLTQASVGSFVFDRFKISDILNKQFGLQVNLGTVLEQSQTDSLLAGRSQDGQSGTLGRTRSATKIELKKRLDEALSLSVSSTMGGSIGQRQSMNLNYGLIKNVQLEGIYELRTNAEGEEDIIDKSIGADLKFRWTFK